MNGYKIVEVTSLYGKYIDYFYKKSPDTKSKVYAEHLKDILYDSNAECDFIHTELHKLGVESSLYFLNLEDLQRSWNPDVAQKTLFEIFCEQLRIEKPDILLISDIGSFTIEQIKALREILPKHAKITGWHFTVVDDYYREIFKYFDQLYTGSIYFCNLIAPHCKDVRLLRHAFSPVICERIKQRETINNAVFAGSIFLGENIHTNRVDMLYSLLSNDIPIKFYGSIYGSFYPDSIKECIKQFIKNDFLLKQRKCAENLIKKAAFSDVFGLDYYQVLADHSLCINSHAPIAATGTGNMRMFEATGVGACLVTDYREENALLFDIKNEIVVYKDNDELREKTRWLIDHPAEAKRIAIAGQKRTLRDYTYKNKAESLHEYWTELLKK